MALGRAVEPFHTLIELCSERGIFAKIIDSLNIKLLGGLSPQRGSRLWLRQQLLSKDSLQISPWLAIKRCFDRGIGISLSSGREDCFLPVWGKGLHINLNIWA
jgi:hypothetical protein